MHTRDLVYWPRPLTPRVDGVSGTRPTRQPGLIVIILNIQSVDTCCSFPTPHTGPADVLYLDVIPR